MAVDFSRFSRAELPGTMGCVIGRCYFGTAGALALATALLLSVVPAGVPFAPRAALLAAFALYVGGCAWGWAASARPRFPINAALFICSIGALALALAVCVLLRTGLRDPGLAYASLMACTLCAVTRRRYGVALAGVAAVMVTGLAAAEAAGWLRVDPAPWPLLVVALLMHGFAIAGGVVAGALIARVLHHFLNAAGEREHRFRGLLHIAADWYWEQDAEFRYTHSAVTPGRDPEVAPEDLIGSTPWELPDMGLSDEQMDAHRADLESHAPFSGLLARRVDSAGRLRHVSLSGEPLFGADGAFLGYWGVGRDVSAEFDARHAVEASEVRYHELFARSPTPLVLHRRGIVIEANAAAERMFGLKGAGSAVGLDLVPMYAEGESRGRVLLRLDELERLPQGTGLPVADFQMRSRTGQRLSVQATSVAVQSDDGPATLTIYFDITARAVAEQALRHSEALLSHLFATSPDVITLSDLATGRYAMVNDSFTAVTGYTAQEVIGRTAVELGLYSAELQQQLTRLVRQRERVHELPAVLVAKSGARVSMLIAAAHFAMGEREYLVINARDVTESERARLEHEAILQRASIGIAMTREGRFVRANPRFERMFGWQAGTLPGQSAHVVWPSEADHAEVDEMARPLLAEGMPVELEREMRRFDGSLFWCRLLAQVVSRTDPAVGGTIWIAEDVTERRQIDQTLAAARDAAEAASRAKSAFLANTSHEIRTPLNGLLGLARLAMQRDLDEARRQQYLHQILDSAQSLAGIISDILDLSKIEAGKITLDSVNFALRDTLGAVHQAYTALAEAKGLELMLHIAENVPATVCGDPVRLRQILSNFVTNALKFTERGRVVIEAASLPDGRIRLAVQDTGPGIEPDVQRRLFLPFSQADASTTRRYGGSGLGLSICRELAHLMGGEVGVDSRASLGSTFWAELPLRVVTLPEVHADSESEQIELLSGARVLMVEDNPVNMMIAVATLEQWGVQVEQAGDGAMAVHAVEHAARMGRPFDAVLMDVHMPVMNGHAAVRVLRERHDAQRLPIVALTAAALVSEREEALAAGMNDFLTKPLDARRLRQTLVRLLRPTEAV